MAAAAAQTSSESQQNGQTTAVASNGNGYVKNSSDMAIYEQYRNQVWLLFFCLCYFFFFAIFAM